MVLILDDTTRGGVEVQSTFTLHGYLLVDPIGESYTIMGRMSSDL
jgi:hypothetical protein